MHISELHEKFNELDINSENYKLYQALLDLDVTEFNPIMEAILNGEMDIEDTRKILPNDFRENRNDGDLKVKRSPLLQNEAEVIRNNFINRFNQNNQIIKESVVPILSNIDYQEKVANEFERMIKEEIIKSDFEFTDEDIKKIVVIVKNEVLHTINLNDLENNKDMQLLISNLLSFKPIVKV